MHQHAAVARQTRQEDDLVEGVDERGHRAFERVRPAVEGLAAAGLEALVELDGEIRIPAVERRAQGQEVAVAEILQAPDRAGVEDGPAGAAWRARRGDRREDDRGAV